MCRAPIAPAVVALMLGPTLGCGQSEPAGPFAGAPEVDATAGADAAQARDGGASGPSDAARGSDGGHSDAGAADTGMMAALCPPPGPFGLAIGDRVPDVELTDCDGNTRTLHDLCEERAAWMFIFAGW